MKLIRTVLLVAFAIVMALPFGMGKPEYAKKEGKACTFCHPAGKIQGTHRRGAILQGSQPFLGRVQGASRQLGRNDRSRGLGRTTCQSCPRGPKSGEVVKGITLGKPKPPSCGGPQW